MENEGLENVGVVSRVDNTSEKSNTGKIARMENEGLENVGVVSRVGKCRSKPYGTPTGDYTEKALCYTSHYSSDSIKCLLLHYNSGSLCFCTLVDC